MKITCLLENTGGPGLLTEHGLSLYIEVGDRRILFDAGQTDAFAENAALLGVDLSKVDTAILSHGHYDHSGGLMRFMQINDRAPVYVNRNAFEAFYSGPEKYIGVNPTLKESPRIRLTDDETDLGDGMLLCTMNGRSAPFPAFGQGLTVERDGSRAPDPFIHEQYLVIEENEKRVVVSGCSHKGVMNIARWLSPDVLVGGFHFMKLDPGSEADAQVLRDAARQLGSGNTRYYTGHCTGEAPYAFLKPLMGDSLHYLACGETLEI